MSKARELIPETNVQLHTMGKAVRDPYMNMLCLIFVCENHRKILLRKYFEVDSLWFPYIWAQTNTKRLEVIISSIEKLKVCPFVIDTLLDIHHLRVEVSPGKFVLRKTILVNIAPYQDRCCEDFSDLKWFPLDVLLNLNYSNLNEKLFGSVDDFLRIITLEMPIVASEIRYKSLEYYKSKFVEPGQWAAPSCLTAFNITEPIWAIVYEEFMQFTFPIFHMTQPSFGLFMAHHMLTEMEPILYNRLFNAFDHSRAGLLTFIDFISGLIQLEWGCLNDPRRAQFVFRFYDLENKGILDAEQLMALSIDLDVTLALPISQAEFVEMFMTREDVKLLVKFPNSFIAAIVREHEARKVALNDHFTSTNPFNINPISYNVSSKGIKSLQLILRPKISSFLNSSELSTKNTDIMIMLNLLKSSAIQSRDDPSRTFLGDNQRCSGFLLKKVIGIFASLRDVLKKENDTVYVCSPCYVQGDLLGDLDDIIELHQTLMPNFPDVHSKHIFLGNYFSKSYGGFECFLYAACLKLIVPHKVILLMGYNDIHVIKIREVCIQRYGPEVGYLLGEALRETVPFLPLAAIVDGTIYCCNSNVTNDSIENLNKKAIFEKNTLSPLGQKIFSESTTLEDELISKFLKTNDLTFLIRSNTTNLITRSLSNHHIQIGSCSLSTLYQLYVIQIVQEFIKIIAIKSNKVYGKKILLNLESKVN